MSHSPLDLLQHILDEVNFLLTESALLDEDSFSSDEKSKRAFTRSIEIIGEASKKLPDDFKAHHSQIEWKPIARMRDKLIHHYFGVDYPLVWDTIITDIPNLKIEITKIIEAEQSAKGDDDHRGR